MKVFYFSATGRTKTVAAWIARELGAPLVDLESCDDSALHCETAIVVFPVYCQNIPLPVLPFLKALAAQNISLIACYGGKGHGNVLQEASRILSGTVIASACIPIGHTYLDEQTQLDPEKLRPLLDAIRISKPVTLPKERKSILAYLFPGLRSQLGIKLLRSDTCNSCGVCTQCCPMHTMKNGRPGGQCIRCLRCVSRCPGQALTAVPHPLLKYYLNTTNCQEFRFYL